MELQNTSPNLTSRESVQRKIANALDYLGENYNIVDKSVREGDATTMDIARSFTGDVKSDKLSENIGLLDFSPFGTYFAAEEGQDAINKAEPNAFKRQMALLNYLRQPLQTIIDRPDIGLPATDIALGGIEAIPFGYVVTKPIKGFLKSLKAKAIEPLNDVGMNIQKTSLLTSGDVSTTTKPVKNEEINQSRRKFVKDTGTLGALGLISTQVPDAIKLIKKAKVATKLPVTYESARNAFVKPQLLQYMKDINNPEDASSLVEVVEDILFDRVPEFAKASYEGPEGAGNFLKSKYGLDKTSLENLSVEDVSKNKKLMNDLMLDVGGDDEFAFRQKVQSLAIKDGGKIENDKILSNQHSLEMYEDTDVINERNKAVSDYYNTLKTEGKSADEIAEFMFEDIEYDTGLSVTGD